MALKNNKKQSKWMICGLNSKSDEWIIIGNRSPMLSPDDFYTAIEPYRRQFSHFGVWVVPFDWVPRGVLVSRESIRSIDEIFLDKTQIKCSDDILEKMTWVDPDRGRTLTVLASREGFVMVKDSVSVNPELIHWTDLMENFCLSDSLVKLA